MTREQRDSLRRLAEAATPGPWAYSPRRGTIGVRSNDHDQSFGMMADTAGVFVEWMTNRTSPELLQKWFDDNERMNGRPSQVKGDAREEAG